MLKRSSKIPRESDANQPAEGMVEAAKSSGESEIEEKDEKLKNPAAVALGKLGGKKGGPARAKKLTPERRSEIAREAAKKRWEEE